MVEVHRLMGCKADFLLGITGLCLDGEPIPDSDLPFRQQPRGGVSAFGRSAQYPSPNAANRSVGRLQAVRCCVKRPAMTQELRMQLFRPILPGATIIDRVVACVGAVLGIAATGLVARWTLGADTSAPMLMIASMGASAVLVFAVPASPLAQPWPVIGGNVLSAAVGVAIASLIDDPMIGGGVAVGAAIAVMSLCRCLHPPGGGTALIPVLAGTGAPAASWLFPLLPVALNAALLIGVAWAFHRFSGHRYPRVSKPSPAPQFLINDEDIAHALSQLHETLDVNVRDLHTIATLAAEHAQSRS